MSVNGKECALYSETFEIMLLDKMISPLVFEVDTWKRTSDTIMFTYKRYTMQKC